MNVDKITLFRSSQSLFDVDHGRVAVTTSIRGTVVASALFELSVTVASVTKSTCVVIVASVVVNTLWRVDSVSPSLSFSSSPGVDSSSSLNTPFLTMKKM